MSVRRWLVTGNGKSGSWFIRGEQLGAAIGADVMPNAETAEIRPARGVIVVKRTPEWLTRRLRNFNKPWVWDVVDAWPQPKANEWDEEVCIRWLKDSIARLGPNAIVFPTSRMLQDSGWKGPALVLPHHAWPKYQRKVVSEFVQKVGYEGDPRYLGKWQGLIEAECERRGWRFQVGDLSECDIGICLRDTTGYACGAWKANTKLANCQALGIPAICSPEFSYWEFGSGTEAFVKSADALKQAFNDFAPYETRLAISEGMQRHVPTIEKVAADYKAWLNALNF